jgi:hypothetical protein
MRPLGRRLLFVLMIAQGFARSAEVSPSTQHGSTYTGTIESFKQWKARRQERARQWEHVGPTVDQLRRLAKQPACPVPLIYNPRLHPWPLVHYQVQRTLAWAERTHPDGRQVWFVYVITNTMFEWKYDYAVRVCFVPDRSSPRFRKGRYGWFGSGWKEREPLGKKLESGTASQPVRQRQNQLDEYFQVSPENKPFGADPGAPDSALLPFDAPSGFTDEEVVKIVDFIRTNPRVRTNRTSVTLPAVETMPTTWSWPDRVDGSKPIMSIVRKGLRVVVTTGTQEGPLCGAGEEAEFEQHGDSFVAISIALWVS